MHKPKSVLENEILRAMEMQTEHPILDKRLNVVLIKKKRTCYIMHFAVKLKG